MKPNFDARRVLAHPLWWCAALVLVTNDHLFKGADVLPSGLTGKLSDFAGLLMAPAVLATLIGVNRRWGWTGSHVLTGVVFAAINVSPMAAAGFEAAMAYTPFPWWITVDPTDLVALPALIVSWRFFGRWAERPVALQPALWRLGAAVGGIASLATSPPLEPTCEQTGECVPCWEADDPDLECIDPWWAEQQFFAAFSLQNGTNASQVFRVRQLKPSVSLDCDTVATNPTAFLHPALFAPAAVWVVDPRRGVALWSGTDPAAGIAATSACTALFVDGPNMPRSLVFWQDDDYPLMQLSDSETNATDAQRSRMIFVRENESGPGVATHPAVFAMGSQDDELIEPICQTPEEGTTLGWSNFPDGREHEIFSLDVGADGCHVFQFVTSRWYFCAPGLTLPFAAEDVVRFGQVLSTAEVPIPGFRLEGPNGSIEVAVGDSMPGSAPAVIDTIEGCDHHRDSCGGAVRPLALSFDTMDGTQTARAGQQAHIDETTTAFVYRAQSQAVVDADCAPGSPESRARLEMVVVTNLMSDSSSETPDGDGSSADPENSENSENPERSEAPSDAPDGQADEEDME